jgi:LysR family transcriptional regulator, regulator for genes of the gallate degradation pathway
MDLWALNLRHLAALAATKHLGSLSAAAQAVNLSQPALTQGLAKLERQFGQKLFERQPDGMTTTEAATMLTGRIEAALAHIGSPRVTMAQVRALIAIGDGGSYAAASAATGLAQPSLHRAIGDLAVALRRTLVERRGKGISLTAAGRQTLRNFRLARAELAAGLSEVAALAGRDTGRITIGAMPLSRARLLPAAVTAFHRKHPDFDVRIIEGSYAEMIEPLRDGEIDLLIGALRDQGTEQDVVQQALFEDRPVVLGRAGHPLSLSSPERGGGSPLGLTEGSGEAWLSGSNFARATSSPSTASTGGPPPRSGEDFMAILAAYPWTISAPGTPLRTQWERMFADAGVAPPHVPIECGSVITIRQILRDSDFLTLLSPDQVAVELEAGVLVKLCDAPPNLVRTIGITTRGEWRPTGMQAYFMKALATQSEVAIVQ